MNKYKETFGVDIGKHVFDVHGSRKGHNQHKNDETEFKKYLKELPEGSLVVIYELDHFRQYPKQTTKRKPTLKNLEIRKYPLPLLKLLKRMLPGLVRSLLSLWGLLPPQNRL